MDPQYRGRPSGRGDVIGSVWIDSDDLDAPKVRLPGEGGRPFEPGRVRDDLVLRAGWKSASTVRSGWIPDGPFGLRQITHPLRIDRAIRF